MRKVFRKQNKTNKQTNKSLNLIGNIPYKHT